MERRGNLLEGACWKCERAVRGGEGRREPGRRRLRKMFGNMRMVLSWVPELGAGAGVRRRQVQGCDWPG